MAEKTPKIIQYPKDIVSIVDELLEKYSFKEIQERRIKKFLKSKNSKQRKEIFESLPGTKISKLIKDYTEKKITPSELPEFLKRDLNISEKKAKQLTKDLENKILYKIKTGKEKLPTKEIKPPKKLKRKDIYREPIE